MKQDNGESHSYLADALAHMLRSMQEEHKAGREQGKPNQIQVATLRLFAIVRQKKNGQYYCQYADRQVDEKEPAPRGELQDSAGNHGAEERPQHDRHGGIADDARHMFSGSAR